MSLIALLVTIGLVGLMVWALTEIVPMPPQFKKAILVIAVVGLVFYVLSACGLLSGFRDIKIGK